MSALLDAATRLFAEHGPGAVSLRDVAREANVNLGLIHRYIGGKQDLLAMVLEQRPGMPPVQPGLPKSAEEMADLLLDLIASDPAYTKVMMRASLDGFDVPELPISHPLLQRAATSLRNQLPPREAGLRVAFLAAAVYGWQAVGALLLQVLEEDEISADELTGSLRQPVLSFLTADPS